MHNPFTLQGKTVLVTGASSGIGRSTAIECSRMGAKVMITGRDKNRLNQTFDMLESDGHAQYIADLTDDGQMEGLVQALPPLNGVVHSAGTLIQLPAKFIEREELFQVINTNLFSVILLNKMLICEKKLATGASFVFISSLASNSSDIGNTMYAASKGGLNAVARTLAKELISMKARVNIISPGMIETPLIDNFWQEDRQKDESRYLLGYGKPEDVAYCAVYLLSDAAKWITGSNFVVDGGVTL